MQKKNDSPTILNLMASAGLGGGLLAGGMKVLSPTLRNIPGALDKLGAIGKAGLTGGAISSGLVGMGGAAGSALLGAPRRGEDNPWTRRAATGGLVGGGLVGAALGGLYGAGGLGKIAKIISAENKAKIANTLSDFPTDNVVMDYMKKIAAKPGLSSSAQGAAIGGLGLGGISAYLGADEGMQADVIENERLALLRNELNRRRKS